MPTSPVGYLTNHKSGLEGEPGIGYDYILAANGLFIRASNPLLSATIQIAPAEVRGLAPLTERLELTHGRIPFGLIQTALWLLSDAGASHEVYMGVVWENGAYQRVFPEQTGSPASVQYQRARGVLLDIHTHGKMSAFFSGTDDHDEQGFQLYMVLGRLDHPVIHEVALRLGVFGYFAPLDWDEVFDQPPPAWVKVVTASPNLTEGEPGVPRKLPEGELR